MGDTVVSLPYWHARQPTPYAGGICHFIRMTSEPTGGLRIGVVDLRSRMNPRDRWIITEPNELRDVDPDGYATSMDAAKVVYEYWLSQQDEIVHWEIRL